MGHLGWLFKLNLHPRHQHCTDEAQKAETVLSAVSYIYIYISLNNLQFNFQISFVHQGFSNVPFISSVKIDFFLNNMFCTGRM